MNFQLTEDRLALQQAVKEFAEKELAPGVIERDEKSEYPVELYKKMGEMGLIGLPYAKEYGGSGRDYLDYAIAVEEISKVDASVGISYSVSTSLYGGSIANGGSEEQKREFLPEVLSGKTFGSFGLTEPNAGSDAGGCVTIAEKKGDKYILNGLKCFNTNGPLSDHFAVYALTHPELGSKGLSCFHVKKGTPGFSIGKIENKMGIRSAQVSELVFENCEIPETALLGEEKQGFKIAMKTLDGGRLGVAAQSLGIAQCCLEESIRYAKERKQFGRPIAKFQAISFMIADMATEIEAAREMIYSTALAKDAGEKDAPMKCSMCKLFASEMANRVAYKAVQIHGGYGYMRDYKVERMYRDARITTIYEGTSQVQQMVIAGNLLK